MSTHVKSIVLFFSFLASWSNSWSQGPGLIINEASNGNGGSQDWVELLVLGDPSDPLAMVDISGWKFDDNNGEFESGGTGVGIAGGHLIFDATWTSVPPGSLIVIYNQSDKDALIGTDDPTDSNSDGVYILPGNHSSLDACSSLPSTSDTTYPTCTDSPSWSRVALANTGDVAQTRRPDGSFFHGFSYGNVTAPYPTFPGGGSSFNAGAGGTGSTFAFQCGDWENAVNFVRSLASGRTPGSVNSSVNRTFIMHVTLGDLDYSMPASSANCAEICNNGYDDDGDELIDSYDPDCFTNTIPSCGTTGVNDYYGVQAVCQYPVPTDPFAMQEIWASEAPSENTSRTFALAGDLDGDCIPEVVFTSNGNEYGNSSNGIIIADGATGLTKTLIPHPGPDEFAGTAAISLADVDSDGNGDLLFYDRDGDVYRYEWDGTTATQIYRKTNSDATEPLSRDAAEGYSTLGDYKFSTSIADINHDGIPEMVIGNQVINTITGAELCAGSTSDPIGSRSDRINTSVLVDVIGDDALDLVVGNAVYTISIPAGGAYGSGTITKTLNMASASPSVPGDGYVAVADMDEDGDLDVVSIVGSTIYVWDPSTGTVLGSTALPGSGEGTSPTIGDVDNLDPDGAGPRTRDMEILFHRNSGVYVVKFDPATFAFTTMASVAVSDGSETTISLFDFQGDGQVDILYRDQSNLRMLSYDGTATLQDIVAAVPCPSSTSFEHPMAVDITGDGQTELVCDCDGNIKAFGSSNANVPLIPSRKVWNQWSYFVVNINDDLTVPRYQQDHSVNKGINTFWQQLPLWDPVAAQPILAAPDVTVTIDSISCIDGTSVGTVYFHVDNEGEGTYPSNSYVSFYESDPTMAGSVFLGRVQLLDVLGATDSENGTFTIDGYPSLDLFAVVNDDGLATLPYVVPSSTNVECDYSNNSDSQNSVLCLSSDSDGDAVPDLVDIDDDNDGIPDCQESSDTMSENFGWTMNSPVGGLEVDDTSDPSVLTWPVSSTGTMTFGAGLNYNTASTQVTLTSIVSNSYSEALINDEYIELSFTTGASVSLFHMTNLRSGWFQTGNTGDSYYSATRIAPALYDAWTILSQDVFHTKDGSPYPVFDHQVVTSFYLEANTEYRLRFFCYGQIDDDPATTSIFDDLVVVLNSCLAQDSDSDNVSDHFDRDSDNDGIFDLVEAGHAQDDLNANGVIDGVPSDFGANGLFDAIETSPDSSVLVYMIADSDSDGNIDSVELDSDNDGCFDVIEAGYLDQDNNGLLGSGN